MEFVQCREYVVCNEPPVMGYVPGVFVLEQTPPFTAPRELFEGWKIPESSWGWKRLIQKSVKHFHASTEHDGCSTCVIMMKADVPIPKWFAPVGMINKIVLTTTMESF